MRLNVLLLCLLIAVASLPLLFVGYVATHIPGADDVEAANAVGRFIEQGFGKFDSREQVERTGQGKIWYVRPTVGPSPVFIIYEVTKPEEIAEIEALANQALAKVPAVKVIKRMRPVKAS